MIAEVKMFQVVECWICYDLLGAPSPSLSCLWFGNPSIFVFCGTWDMFKGSVGILLHFSPSG